MLCNFHAVVRPEAPLAPAIELGCWWVCAGLTHTLLAVHMHIYVALIILAILTFTSPVQEGLLHACPVWLASCPCVQWLVSDTVTLETRVSLPGGAACASHSDMTWG